MSSEALLTFVGKAQARVMVVAAGPRTPGLVDVGDAVAKQLRVSKALAAVFDGARLGDLSDVDNDEIVRRATSLPVDRIMIVRVTGRGPEAVVYTDTYVIEGRRYAGFVLTAGDVLAPHVDPLATAGDRESIFDRAEALAESEDLVAGSNDVSDAEREYFEKSLVYPRGVVLRGIYRDPLQDRDALEYMGDEALLPFMDKRRRIKHRLMVSGIVVGSSLSVPGIAAAALGGLSESPEVFHAGLAILGVGASVYMLAIVGATLRDPAETVDMATEVARYNQRLRLRLDLPPNIRELVDERTFAQPVSARRSRPRPSWALAPAPTLGAGRGGVGAQLVISGHF